MKRNAGFLGQNWPLVWLNVCHFYCSNQFYLTSESLNRLNGDGYEKCSIKVGDKKVEVRKDLSIFISKDIYRYLKEYSNEFPIDTSKNGRLLEESITLCLKKIISLTEGANSIRLDHSDAPFINYLCGSSGSGWSNVVSDLARSEDSIQLQWNSTLLGNFNDLKDANEFCFKVGSDQFKCPKVLARLLSSKASEKILSDSSSKEFDIQIPKAFDPLLYSNAFRMLFRVLSGDEFNIYPKDIDIVRSISSSIGCEELTRALEPMRAINAPIDKFTIYDHLKNLPFLGSRQKYSEIIEFTASHLWELNLDRLSSIPIQILQTVIESPKLKLQNETQLFRFFQTLSEARAEEAVQILMSVKFEYLDSKSFEELKTFIEINTIPKDVWVSVCNSLKRAASDERPFADRWKEQPNLIFEQMEDLRNELSTAEQMYSELKESKEKEISKMNKEIAILRKKNKDLECDVFEAERQNSILKESNRNIKCESDRNINSLRAEKSDILDMYNKKDSLMKQYIGFQREKYKSKHSACNIIFTCILIPLISVLIVNWYRKNHPNMGKISFTCTITEYSFVNCSSHKYYNVPMIVDHYGYSILHGCDNNIALDIIKYNE